MKLVTVPITEGPFEGLSVGINTANVVVIAKISDTKKMIFLGSVPGQKYEILTTSASDAAVNTALTGETYFTTTATYYGQGPFTVWINKLFVNGMFDATTERRIYCTRCYSEPLEMATTETYASLQTKFNTVP